MQNKLYFFYGVLLCFVFVLVTICGGCNCVKGSKVFVSDTLVFAGLSKLDIDGDFKVFLRQDTSLSGRLVIVAEDNIAPRVVATRLVDSTLVVGFDAEGCFGRYERVELYVSMPRVEGLKVVGDGRLVVESDIVGSVRVDLDVWGGGDVVFKKLVSPIVDVDLNGGGNVFVEEITANALSTSISGLGDLEVGSGDVYSHNLDLLGGGNFYGFYLYATDYDVIVNSTGGCEVNCSGELRVFMNGVGNVYYRGLPQSIVVSGTGTGVVGGG